MSSRKRVIVIGVVSITLLGRQGTIFHSDIKPLNLNFNSFIRDKAKIKEIVMSKLILQQEFVYN